MINYSEARQKAAEMARADLNGLIDTKDMKLLEDRYLESRNCWFFFRNRDIKVPLEFRHHWELDYMVSKKGLCMSIFDFYEDEDKLQKYLEEYTMHLDRTEG